MRYGVAPEDLRIATVATVESSPYCDGKLEHACWNEATELDDFRVRVNGRKATVDTKVRLICDGRNLHVAFVCEEPDLTKVLTRVDESDSHDDSREDCAIVCVDPGLTRRRAFTFNLFPSGRREGDVPDEDWAGAVAVGENRWVAQFILPLKTLGIEPAEGEVWGIALARCRHGDRRYPEVSTWGPSDLKAANPRDFGLLVFRGGLSEAEASARGETVRSRLQAIEDADDWRARIALGPPAITDESELPIVRGAAWELPQGRATVTAADNPRIVRGTHPFVWQRADEPQLRDLRERYELDRVVEGAADDFEEGIRLQLWTIDHLTFGRPAHHDYNALRLLEDATRGRTFYCTHYSYVFMQVCLAMGIPARKLTTIGHASNEFWSNRWRKWITLECTRGHYFEKDGVPLDALAVHNEFIRNGGIDMDFSVGAERAIRKVSLERRDDGMIADAQERYQWFASLMRNNILSVPLEEDNFRFLWWRDDYNRELKEIVIRPDRPPHRFRNEPEEGWEPIYVPTEDPDDLYWTLNQAELHATPSTEGVRISVSTVTPGFARFEARIDSGNWQRVEPTFDWPLRKGSNTLEVRPVNAFGRAGITSSLTVEVK